MDKPCIFSTGLSSGYPRRMIEGKTIYLHRQVLEQKLGRPIREGYEACHSCNHSNCIEPEHIYEGTHTDNMWDLKKAGNSRFFGKHNREKTHCPHGHEYTEENTKIYRGYRWCKTCEREEWRKKNIKRKELRQLRRTARNA